MINWVLDTRIIEKSLLIKNQLKLGLRLITNPTLELRAKQGNAK